MYTAPRSLFQQKIKNLLKDPECSPIFEDIFKLMQLYSLEKISPNRSEETNWKIFLLIYEELGASNLAKLVSITKGKSVTLPSEEDFQDAIITSLCYYYKEVEGKSWEDIKQILNLPELNTIKYGIRVRQFSQFVQSQILRKFHKYEDGKCEQ